MIYRGYDVESSGLNKKIKRGGHLVITLDNCDDESAMKWIDKHKAALANDKNKPKR